MLPPSTKASRASQNALDQANNKPTSPYDQMTKAISDLHNISAQEGASPLPTCPPKWSRPLILEFMTYRPKKKFTKDTRVGLLSRILEIGATNILDVCKNFILAALPKLRRGFGSLLYQRVAIGETSDKYRYLELLALFTAIYLQAEADKKTKGKRYEYQAMPAQRTGCNPYKDFLDNTDIKNFTKPEKRGYLLALSMTLCDSKILCGLPGMASRDIQIPSYSRPKTTNKLGKFVHFH
jgi:hypothetical protein